MDIFGVGGWELALVVVLAVVIFGPERIARHAYQVGRWARQFSAIWQEATTALREQLTEELGEDLFTQEDLARIRARTPVASDI